MLAIGQWVAGASPAGELMEPPLLVGGLLSALQGQHRHLAASRIAGHQDRVGRAVLDVADV